MVEFYKQFKELVESVIECSNLLLEHATENQNILDGENKKSDHSRSSFAIMERIERVLEHREECKELNDLLKDLLDRFTLSIISTFRKSL